MGGTKYAILGIPATSAVINGWHYSRCCVPISSLVIYYNVFKMRVNFHSSCYYVGHHICTTPVLALFPSHLFIGFSFPIISLGQIIQWQFRISCHCCSKVWKPSFCKDFQSLMLLFCPEVVCFLLLLWVSPIQKTDQISLLLQ